MMTLFFVTSCEMIPFYDVAKEKAGHAGGNYAHTLTSFYSHKLLYSEESWFFFYIVFKCTGTKIISLYLQYVTHLVFTYTSYTCVAVVVLSCCTVVFWLGSVGLGIRTCLDWTRCRLHSSFFAISGPAPADSDLDGTAWIDESLIFVNWGPCLGRPTSSFLTPPAHGCLFTSQT